MENEILTLEKLSEILKHYDEVLLSYIPEDMRNKIVGVVPNGFIATSKQIND